MIETLISDVEKALDAEAYMAALSLVLTLPDICAKAEYVNSMKNKDRYIKWYDEYIGKYEKSPRESNDPELPYLSGEVVYQLRCMMLHQGTPNIDKSKISEESCKIDQFVLAVGKKNQFGVYSDESTLSEGRGKYRTYRVSVRRLCIIICSTTRGYYKANPEKFDFFEYTILDWDKAVENLSRDSL